MQTAQTPFQTYGGEFVAPVNQTQAAGITGVTNAAGQAQPYYGAATGVIGQSQANVNPINQYAEGATAASSAPLTASQIDQYLSPYLNEVLGSTEAIQNQENQQQQAGQLGDAITSGAFGGDRAGIAAANLEQQQNLANANVISGIANTGYQSALSTAQGQQQIGLAGAQQLAGIGQTAYGEGANTATTLAGIGSGAQSAAISGANAEIAAGTVEQQTAQAQDTAEYNQFLQQQSYPFQVDQFLANIAEGTGSLSGSATITQQPGGFFSDKRLKRDIKKVGKTFDGQDVVTYKMGDDNRTRIGLIAQDVEKKHPQAVGVAGGFKTVDYGKATDKAANQGHFHAGGVVPMRMRRASGGETYDLSDVLAAQRQMYGQGTQQRNINAAGSSGGHSLPVANAPSSQPPSGMSEVGGALNDVRTGQKIYQSFKGTPSGVSGGTGGTGGTGGFTTVSTGVGDTQIPAGAAASAPADAAPVAADAASSGAASGAASTATGVAAGAATDAAADAAVDEAATAAAEYMAADLGPVVVAAFGKGGGIRRGRDLGGGLPYSQQDSGQDDQNLNIPDDQNANTLKAAPAAGKQPTGLQTLMYMGNPNNGSTMFGDMFSNQALKRGGVAGRGRFADGGPPDGAAPLDDDGPIDMSDVIDSLPQETVTATPETTSAPTATGVAGGSGTAQKQSWLDKGKEFWDSNKGVILPILQGLGAMGTAKTVHPGVALAAGLEAGAQAYVPTQEGLATAAKTSAEAQQEQTMADVKQFYAKKLLNPTAQPTGVVGGQPYQPSQPQAPQTGLAPAQGAAPQNQNWDDVYRPQLSVNEAWTPAELADLQEANDQQRIGFSAGTSAADQVKARHQARVDDAKFQSRMRAQHNEAQLYAQINDPNLTPQQRAVAQAQYNANFPYTGDTIENEGGLLRNSRTHLAPPGAMGQTLTPEQQSAIYNNALDTARQPIVLGNNLPGQIYQVPDKSGRTFSTPEEFARAQLDAVKGGVFGGGQTPTPTAAVAPAATQTQPPPNSQPPPNAPRAPQTPVAATVLPNPSSESYLNMALGDKNPRYALAKVPTPRTVQEANALDNRNRIVQNNGNALRQEASAVESSSALAIQFMTAAKQILDSKQVPTTGFYGDLINKAGRLLGGTVDSSSYQEVAKYLTNAAVQAGKSSFGGTPTQGETYLQVAEMSPSVDKDPVALRNLLNKNIRTEIYNKTMASRVNQFLADGSKEPTQFKTWYEDYFPRAKEINATKIITGKDGKRHYNMGTDDAPNWVTN